MGFAETFKALSDPIRREILMMLRDGSMSAGEIGSHFDMTGALNTSVVEEVRLWLSELKGGNYDVKEE